jgi:hypothetical protein
MNSSCVIAPAAPFHTSSTLNVTLVTMARPSRVAIHCERTSMTSPTKMVLALATSASKVGGLTIVECASLAISKEAINDSASSRGLIAA